MANETQFISGVIDFDETRLANSLLSLQRIGRAFGASSSTDIDHALTEFGKVDALFISSSVNQLLNYCQTIRDRYPQSRLFVLVDPKDRNGQLATATIPKLYSLGMSSVVTFPLTEEDLIRLAPIHKSSQISKPTSPPVEYIDFSQQTTPPSRRRISTRVIACIGTLNVSDHSKVSLQTAMWQARNGNDVLIIDGNFAGYLDELANVEKINTIEDFQSDVRQDRDFLMNKLVQHKQTGLYILPAPNDGPVTDVMLRHAIDAYKPYFSYIFVDLAPGYHFLFFELMRELATDFVVVASPEFAGLKRQMKFFQSMSEDEFPTDRVHVLVNKVTRTNGERGARVAAKEFGYTVCPLPYTEDLESFVPKPPLFSDPSSRYAQAFEKFATNLFGDEIGERNDVENEEQDEKDTDEPETVGWFRKIINFITSFGRRGAA